ERVDAIGIFGIDAHLRECSRRLGARIIFRSVHLAPCAARVIGAIDLVAGDSFVGIAATASAVTGASATTASAARTSRLLGFSKRASVLIVDNRIDDARIL